MNGTSLFRLLPLEDTDPYTPQFCMMKYVTSHSGYTLYSFTTYIEGSLVHEYFVYENEKLHVRIDPKNAPSVLKYFDIDAF
jgi:hypothetical protein